MGTHPTCPPPEMQLRGRLCSCPCQAAALVFSARTLRPTGGDGVSSAPFPGDAHSPPQCSLVTVGPHTGHSEGPPSEAARLPGLSHLVLIWDSERERTSGGDPDFSGADGEGDVKDSSQRMPLVRAPGWKEKGDPISGLGVRALVAGACMHFGSSHCVGGSGRQGCSVMGRVGGGTGRSMASQHRGEKCLLPPLLPP